MHTIRSLRTAATLLLLATPLAAQRDPAPRDTTSPDTAALDTTRWSPALSMRYRGVAGTALSPDGSMAAWGVREPVMEGEESEYRTHIWVAPTDEGYAPMQWTRGDASASSPAFSPDGRWLAFTTRRGGSDAKTQVWVMDMRGGEAFPATRAEEGVGSFAWSPDGSRIAYTMTAALSEERRRAEKEKRAVIVVDDDFRLTGLWVAPFEPAADSLPEPTLVTPDSVHVTSFDWSPDGRALVFAHAPDPRINTTFSESDLAVVPSDGGAVRPLVTRPGSDGSPLWSPDGRWIAFGSQGGQPEHVGLEDVWVVAAGGGDPRRLGETPDRSANLVAWSADGRGIYATESIGTDRSVITVPLDGGAPRRVTTQPGVYGSPAFDRSTSIMLFTWQDVDQPEEVYASAVGSAAREPLSAVNREVPRPPMGRTEVLRWHAPDGTPVEGLLTYPVDYREGRRYPLILNVHGGPAGVFSRNFTGAPAIYMLQTFAQEGYAILRPNPRGSTGYGRDFRYANVKDWGYGDLSDLMAGVDTVIAMGIAHEDSLALMGWSYGGYMTSFAVTRTDRFEAASMGAGLPNLISMTTTTDIPDYLVAHMGGKEFWEDPETYMRHSAIFRIAEVETPTQVIHGAEDLRVPFTQGQEFYVALRRMGVPTEMIVLPRTPHGPREPKLLMAVTPRILSWFERHVREREATAADVASAGR